MNTYSVYLPPNSNDEQEISDAKFLVDGNSLLAIFAPPIWLAWHRLWWGLAVYVAIIAALTMMYFTPLREAGLYLSVIPGIFLMLEGNELVRQRHERRGWHYLGLVQGQNLEDAETRFFETQLLADTAADSPILQSPQPVKTFVKPTTTNSIGLFPLEN